MSLPFHQQFEKQQMATAIASATDLEKLKGLAVQLQELQSSNRETVGQATHGKPA